LLHATIIAGEFPLLKKITILRERVEDWECYPFSISAIRCLDELSFRSRICFFTGENGTGKSTLLEAIAAHYGFGREGGNPRMTAPRAIAPSMLSCVRCDCLSTGAQEPDTS